MNIFQRSRLSLSPNHYRLADPAPLHLGKQLIPAPPVHYGEQYILRMLIKAPETRWAFVIPPELEWLQQSIIGAQMVQKAMFVDHPFCYVTVRSGPVISKTDDEWHVDGFSVKQTHYPETNYIWSEGWCNTQYFDKQFDIPKDFDPFKHNIQLLFQDMILGQDRTTIKSFPNGWNVIDPYVVHRRPPISTGIVRTFIRISFLPLRIEDSIMTPNPLLVNVPYPPNTFRDKLTRYIPPQNACHRASRWTPIR